MLLVKMKPQILLLILLDALRPAKLILVENLNRSSQAGAKSSRQVIPETSSFTDGNIYDIVTVTLLASLGSFLIPSFSTFMTYLVTSNRILNPTNKGRQKVPVNSQDVKKFQVKLQNATKNFNSKDK